MQKWLELLDIFFYSSIDERRSFLYLMEISLVIIITIPCYVKIGFAVSFLVKFCNLDLLRKSRKITVNGSDIRYYTEVRSFEL